MNPETRKEFIQQLKDEGADDEIVNDFLGLIDKGLIEVDRMESGAFTVQLNEEGRRVYEEASKIYLDFE